MKEIKKYTDIVRYGKQNTKDVLNAIDTISITEKLDGANASFTRDEENPLGVTCYSRNNVVNKDNTLRGFYKWITEEIAPMKEELIPDYRYYGEWLVSHTVKYCDDAYYKFYLFSIWDDKTQQYLSDDIIKSEAVRLGLNTPEYMYEGKFISYEHVSSFVGKSKLSKEPNTGEGIVVKNVSYRDRSGAQVFVKLVTDKFRETQKQKPPKDPSIVTEFDIVVESIKSVMTTARIEKMLNKLVDESILSEDYAIEDMSTILKNIIKRLIEDIYKEEIEIVGKLDKALVSKASSKIIAIEVKNILKEQGRM